MAAKVMRMTVTCVSSLRCITVRQPCTFILLMITRRSFTEGRSLYFLIFPSFTCEQVRATAGGLEQAAGVGDRVPGEQHQDRYGKN